MNKLRQRQKPRKQHNISECGGADYLLAHCGSPAWRVAKHNNPSEADLQHGSSFGCVSRAETAFDFMGSLLHPAPLTRPSTRVPDHLSPSYEATFATLPVARPGVWDLGTVHDSHGPGFTTGKGWCLWQPCGYLWNPQAPLQRPFESFPSR